MATIKYFFELDRSGNPIQGSNIKTMRPPKSSFKKWKEIIPLCCSDDNPTINSRGKGHYYVRLDENNLPVSGTLKRLMHKPTNGGFQYQEVEGINCCDTPVPVTTNISFVPATDTTDGSVVFGYISGIYSTPGVHFTGVTIPDEGFSGCGVDSTTPITTGCGTNINMSGTYTFIVKGLTANYKGQTVSITGDITVTPMSIAAGTAPGNVWYYIYHVVIGPNGGTLVITDN